MSKCIELLFNVTPECLRKFTTRPVELSLPHKLMSGPEYITQSIVCLCGNESLSLDASQIKELKGVCTKHEISLVAPPVYVSCKACKRYTLLFDPVMYGWKGEKGEQLELEEVYKLFRCTDQPGRVLVSYSYRNIADYQMLLDNGISNPQDYFDSFSVLYQKTLEDIPKLIFTCMCK